MADVAVCPSIELHKLDKRMRLGLRDLVAKVTMAAVIEGDGLELIERVYLAGLHHGSEAEKRRHTRLAKDMSADG